MTSPGISATIIWRICISNKANTLNPPKFCLNESIACTSAKPFTNGIQMKESITVAKRKHIKDIVLKFFVIQIPPK